MASVSRENSPFHPIFRLSKAFFYILVLFLPFQISKVFFTGKSFYYGFHAFYNTVFVYLTDLLIFGLILAWLWEKCFEVSRENTQTGGPSTSLRTLVKRIVNTLSSDPIYLFTSAFWLILATSLVFSRETSLGFYGLLKITGFLLLFVYIRENLPPLHLPLINGEKEGVVSRENPSPNLSPHQERGVILWIILISACFQSLLAIFQYLTQSSVGLAILGEEFLSPGLKGVAKFATHGIANPLLYDFLPNLSVISDTLVVMRGYGTFPHPNVLAGFLFMALMINFYLLYVSPAKKVLLSVLLIVLSTGLVVTFSRLAWGISLLGILVFLTMVFLKYRSERFRHPNIHFYFPGRIVLILTALFAALGLNLLLFGTQIKDRLTSAEIRNVEISENYIDRKAYSNVAWNMFKANPIFGVGLRNFVVEMDNYQEEERLLPHQHQPVHNIYLLVLAEAGIIALLSFVLLLLNIVRPGSRSLIGLRPKENQTSLSGRPAFDNKKSPAREMLLIIFLGYLILGFFDHYFLTIHHGSLMFWLTAGLLANKKD